MQSINLKYFAISYKSENCKFRRKKFASKKCWPFFQVSFHCPKLTTARTRTTHCMKGARGEWCLCLLRNMFHKHWHIPTATEWRPSCQVVTCLVVVKARTFARVLNPSSCFSRVVAIYKLFTITLMCFSVSAVCYYCNMWGEEGKKGRAPEENN